MHNPSTGENKKIGSNTIMYCIRHYREEKEPLVKVSTAIIAGLILLLDSLFLGLLLGTQQSPICQLLSVHSNCPRSLAKVISLTHSPLNRPCTTTPEFPEPSVKWPLDSVHSPLHPGVFLSFVFRVIDE